MYATVGTTTKGKTFFFKTVLIILDKFYKFQHFKLLTLLVVLFIFFYYLVCPLGYIGPNCTLTCRYPSYGQVCQNKCNCEKPHRDHRTGCESMCLF